MHKHYWLLLPAVLIVGLVFWYSWLPKKENAPINIQTNTNVAVVNASVDTPVDVKMNTFSTADLPDRDPALEFSVSLPAAWRVEYAPEQKAINVYDPTDTTLTHLEASRLYIRARAIKDPSIPTGYTSLKQTTARQTPTKVTIYQLAGPKSPDTSSTAPAYIASDVTMALIVSSDGASSYTVMKSPLVSDTLFSTITNSLVVH